MHDLDRTTLEAEAQELGHEALEGAEFEHGEGAELAGGEFESAEFEGAEFEGAEFEGAELAGEGEQFLGDIVGGLLGGELEGAEFEGEASEGFLGDIVGGLMGGEFEGAELEFEGEGLNEAEAMELAAELLSVSSEQELNYFLGNIIKKGFGAVKKFAGSKVGKSLLGGLKGIAKKALPMVGSALGNMVLPGVGGAIGGKLAQGAGSLLGLELEGLSGEDREFEVAKQLVKLAHSAAKTAAKLPKVGTPQKVALKALVHAARAHAPGLVPHLSRGRLPSCPGCKHTAHASPLHRARHAMHNGHHPMHHGRHPMHHAHPGHHGHHRHHKMVATRPIGTPKVSSTPVAATSPTGAKITGTRTVVKTPVVAHSATGAKVTGTRTVVKTPAVTTTPSGKPVKTTKTVVTTPVVTSVGGKPVVATRQVVSQPVVANVGGKPVVATQHTVTTVPGRTPPAPVTTGTPVGGTPVVTRAGRVVGCSNVAGPRGRWFRRGNKIVLVRG